MPPPPAPPTDRFTELTLESMPPVTRGTRRRQLEESSSDSQSSNDESGFDESTGLLISPSKLAYSLDELDDETKDHFKHTVEMLDASPRLVLQECTSKEQEVNFWLTEPVERCVRIGQPGSAHEVPSCSCQDDNDDQQRDGNEPEKPKLPCAHILWLLDQITERTVDSGGAPLKLTRNGYPAELGNPHERIAEFHLDMLADSLHCDVRKPNTAATAAAAAAVPSREQQTSSRRVREAREMLAALSETPVDEYRPDLFEQPRAGRKAVKKGDLEGTILRMLLRSNDLFHYFSRCMRHHESITSGHAHHALRGLEQTVRMALAGLDDATAEEKDVAWCAHHLLLAERRLGTIVQHTRRPLTERERRGVAVLLIGMLEEVVARSRDVPLRATTSTTATVPRAQRNLYFRLIGERDASFAVGVLAKLPPGLLGGLVPRLERVMEDLRAMGGSGDDDLPPLPPPPATYVEKLGRLVKAARGARAPASASAAAAASSSASAAGAGSKRMGGGQDSSAKRRMK